ncbi:hypothetical protein [Bacillus pseudomycoides]|uniref:hypothetical protein n=1 Tax=Bacillus pseudomycoides TaxID=64104 RepID=UPI002B45C8F6|nr:hypothetical protein [Bacillus pseudomycoides]MEB3057510.1 hypothetical protein [Bacillus pseudomycoides]
MEIFTKINDFIKLALVILAAAQLISLWRLSKKISDEQKVTKEEKDIFYDVLSKGLELNTINTIEDIYNIYKGINNCNSENLNYIHNLNFLLRGFLVRLQAKEIEGVQPEQIKAWKIKIDDFIKKNEELSPFSEIPQAERSMMNDILAYLDRNDNESIKRKLAELSSAIQLRKEEVDKIEKLNTWSIPLAVVGLVLTIIFGIASLI